MKHIRTFLIMLVTAGCLTLGNSSVLARDSSALEVAQQLNRAFIEVAEKVSPAVVVIEVTQKAAPSLSSEDNPLWEMLPPELRRRFFDERGVPRSEGRRSFGRGSGFIITEDGYILTNNHVVEDAEKITVRFKDSQSFSATVRGRDPQSDLAVIKIDAKGLVPLKLADSAATKVGEFAIAVGAPFNFDYSVTIGHVSGKGRSVIPDPMLDQDFIQTDASINPGNSGGPLVNLNGEVIGINSMIAGMNTGIGFAIPSNIARQVMTHLIRDGKFTRSRIGVEIRGLREDQNFKQIFPGIEDGVIVRGITPNTPAARSDLKAGDVIVGVDGRPVKTSRELIEEIAYKKVGQTVTLDVARVDAAKKTRKLKVKVTTEAYPTEDGDLSATSETSDSASTNFGLSVRAITKELASEYGLDTTSGVLVTAVEAGSPAFQEGLRAGDVIIEINRKPVSNLQQFREAMKSPESKKGVVVNFISKGTSRITVLKKEE